MSNGKPLYEVDGGTLRLNPHYGQYKALQSTRRIIAIIAGTQSGKTSFGPHWLWQEIKRCGAGDYMIVTPTFPLLELKALPEFRRIFEDILALGRYISHPAKRFIFSQSGQKRTFGESGRDYETVIHFGYAADPESLESATAKGAWLDEAGQKRFKLGSWEAIQRRLSLSLGRALITTTPYDLGWLKQKLWDRWKAGNQDIDVINFSSMMNPEFPKAEFERAKAELPAWKFDLFYRGIFTRPAGLIYDSFDEALHKCPRFSIPDSWRRYLGLDFGGINTAAVFYAQEPESGKLYLYRTYKAGSRSAREHVEHLLRGEPGRPIAVGGSKSEDQWRREFRLGGLPVREPVVNDVEIGIDRVYAAHRQNQIIVFDDLEDYLEEKMTYSRELDAAGNVTEKIEDKQTFHLLDAERYIISFIKRPAAESKIL